jgi:hypothetical protein
MEILSLPSCLEQERLDAEEAADYHCVWDLGLSDYRRVWD